MLLFIYQLEEEKNNDCNELEVFEQAQKQCFQVKKPRIISSDDIVKFGDFTQDSVRKENFNNDVINEVIENLKENKKVNF